MNVESVGIKCLACNAITPWTECTLPERCGGCGRPGAEAFIRRFTTRASTWDSKPATFAQAISVWPVRGWHGLVQCGGNLAWWWRMRGRRGLLRRALAGVQAARECVERLDDTPIGGVRVYPPEQAIGDAQRELVAAETRLAELADYED